MNMQTSKSKRLQVTYLSPSELSNKHMEPFISGSRLNGFLPIYDPLVDSEHTTYLNKNWTSFLLVFVSIHSIWCDAINENPEIEKWLIPL